MMYSYSVFGLTADLEAKNSIAAILSELKSFAPGYVYKHSVMLKVTPGFMLERIVR